MINFLGCFR